MVKSFLSLKGIWRTLVTFYNKIPLVNVISALTNNEQYMLKYLLIIVNISS